MSRPCSIVAPSARNASRCGSRRRRPITSPPGGGIAARPKRASSGPASRNEARMRSASSRSTSASAVDAGGAERRPRCRRATRRATPSAAQQREHRLDVADPRHVAHARPPRSVSTRGGEDRQGAVLVAGGHDRAGQRHAAFDDELLHEPRAPPIRGPVPERWARVTAMSAAAFARRRPGPCSASGSSRSRCAATAWRSRLAMRAYARDNGADEELWGVAALLHDMDYERHPRPRRRSGHPRTALRRARGVRRRPGRRARDRLARRLPRRLARLRLERRCSPSTSCAGSSLAVRVRAPAGDPRPDAEVGQEEAQAAELRRGRQPRRRPRRRRGARRRLRRARRVRHRRARAARRRAGLRRLAPTATRDASAATAASCARRARCTPFGGLTLSRIPLGGTGSMIVLFVRDATGSFARGGRRRSRPTRSAPGSSQPLYGPARRPPRADAGGAVAAGAPTSPA